MKTAGFYAAAILLGAFALLPILWALGTSLKPYEDAVSFPPTWIPRHLSLKNYADVLFGSGMPRYFLNSFLVALGTIAVTLSTAAHAGYAAARYEFFGKRALLFIILATTMIPGIAILIPLYLVSVKVNLHNTYTVLILVFAAWQTPAVVWMLKGFFEAVSSDVEEAALLDGCTVLGVFYRITLPLAQPGLAAASILVFMFVWSDFLLPFTLTTGDQKRLVSVGLYNYITAYGVEWPRLCAALILALLPVVVLFLCVQGRFISGLMAGAGKA